jgi:nitrous oxidase accessory protein NosD
LEKSGATFILLLVFGSLLVSFPEIGVVKADTTVYIKPDGEIKSTGLIERNGDVYTFTGNIYAPVVIERNNIILDGDSYTLEGSTIGVAINLTTSNVTVKNINIMDWHTGILGAYNNNTILGNKITGCSYGIKIYADEYRIIGNQLADNGEGIRLHGGLNLISQNNIANNGVGLMILGYASRVENIITENMVAYNENGMYIVWNQMGICEKIYRNSFIDNSQQILIPSPFVGTAENPIGVTKIASSTWNNGSEGNYWSDYKGTDNDGDGVGDMPYVIDEVDTDGYPLMAPVGFATVPEFPSWIILPLFLFITLCAVATKKKTFHQLANTRT